MKTIDHQWFQERDSHKQSSVNFLNRHSLIIGIILMFLLTWPIDLANAGVMPFQAPFQVHVLLGYGFLLASILMTRLTLGKGAVITLLKRYLIWRVRWKWFLVAFLLIPGIDLLAVYLNAIVSQTSEPIYLPSCSLLLWHS